MGRFCRGFGLGVFVLNGHNGLFVDYVLAQLIGHGAVILTVILVRHGIRAIGKRCGSSVHACGRAVYDYAVVRVLLFGDALHGRRGNGFRKTIPSPVAYLVL